MKNLLLTMLSLAFLATFTALGILLVIDLAGYAYLWQSK